MLYTANSFELMARPRITVTVSEEVYQYLSEWADREERPLANLAAYLLGQAVRESQQQQEPPKPKNKKGQGAT